MTWQEALQDYFTNLQPPQQQWLQENVLLDAPLLDELPDLAALVALFQTNNRLNHTALFKTLVWQTLGLVLCEKEDPVKGNIRGFWYNFVDPFYSKHNLYKEIRTDDPEYQLYLLDLEPEEITRQPEDLIKKHSTVKLTETTIQAFVFAKIFKYTGPFQFKDGNAGQSLVGRGTASIILFCEKDGLYELVHEAYDDHKISIFCSNGNPSSLSLEVFTDQLKAKKIENVALLGLVDYDPNGFIIAHDYKAKFEAYGFGIKNFSILTSLDLFTEKSLKDDSYSLEKVHPRKENQVQAWFLLTGGIHGQRRGIHVNKASKPRVRKAWTEWIEKEKQNG